MPVDFGAREPVVRLGEQAVEQRRVHGATRGDRAVGVHALRARGRVGDGAVHERTGRADVVGDHLPGGVEHGDVGDAAEVQRAAIHLVGQDKQRVQGRCQWRRVAAAGDVAGAQIGDGGQPGGLGDPGRGAELQGAERVRAVDPVEDGLPM